MQIWLNDPEISLNAGSEKKDHNLIGTDIGLLLGKDNLNVFVEDNMKNFKNIDIVIEFGLKKATNSI